MENFTKPSTSIEALFTPTSASIKSRETGGERDTIMMVCSAHDCLNFRLERIIRRGLIHLKNTGILLLFPDPLDDGQ